MYFRQFSGFKKLNSLTPSPQEAPWEPRSHRENWPRGQAVSTGAGAGFPDGSRDGEREEDPGASPRPEPGQAQEQRGGKPSGKRCVPLCREGMLVI